MNNEQIKELMAYIQQEKAKATSAYNMAKAGELQAEDLEAKRDYIVEEVFRCSQVMAYHNVLKKIEEIMRNEI